MAGDYGLRVKMDNGNVFDSRLDGASLVDSIHVPIEVITGEKAYPLLAGLEGYAVVISTSAGAFGTIIPVFSYENGYPILRFTRHYPVRGIYINSATIMVFAR